MTIAAALNAVCDACSAWPYAIGFAYSLFVGHFGTRCVVDRIYAAFPETGKWPAATPLTRPVLGLVERTLYTSCLLADQPAFIGVWLAIKVAARLKGWGEAEGREYFNMFLIGSGLSVLYGAAGAMIVDWLRDEAWATAVGVALALVGFTALLMALTRGRRGGTSAQGSNPGPPKSAPDSAPGAQP